MAATPVPVRGPQGGRAHFFLLPVCSAKSAGIGCIGVGGR